MAATAVILAAAATAATAATAVTGAVPPTKAVADPFDRAFPADGEPAALHYTARYDDRRGSHTLEVWRQGNVLRRRTDEAIDLYAERHADSAAAVGRLGGDTLTLEVLDHRRRIATQVSGDALYRVGHGVEWFSLAHGLARPRSAFDLQPWKGPPPAAAADCHWTRLQQGARGSAVCWNARLHLPARIVDLDSGRTVWTLLTADTAPIDKAVFTARATDYVRVDADKDIQAD